MYTTGIFLLIGVAATALATAGLGLLFLTWKRRLTPRWLILPAGWALLLSAVVVWVMAAGYEFGISFSFICVSLVAWLFVVANRELRTARSQETSQPTRRIARRGFISHLSSFLAAVPLAATASMFVPVALCLLLPQPSVNMIVVVMMVMPLLWGFCAWWLLADVVPLRPVLVIGTSTAISAVIIYS